MTETCAITKAGDSVEVLYRDDHYIAVTKPSGLFVHRSELDPRADFLLHYVRDLAGTHVWPVHRLDRPTCGLIVFACSREAAGALSVAFRERQVRKTYLAVVRGFTDASGVIDHPLAPEREHAARPAQTAYTRLKTTEIPVPVGPYDTARYSLVTVRPHTGRKHQIRRHFDHLFHPLIGDRVYGDGRHNRMIRERYGVGRLLLSSTGLCFTHPYTRQPVTLSATPSSDMARVIGQMFV